MIDSFAFLLSLMKEAYHTKEGALPSITCYSAGRHGRLLRCLRIPASSAAVSTANHIRMEAYDATVESTLVGDTAS